MTQSRRERQAGSAMLIALMMLVLMGLMGISAIDTSREDQTISGLTNRSRSAFHAAEAGAAHARRLVAQADDRNDTPALPTTLLGDAAMYARYQTRPSYAPDPSPPGGGAPIEYVQDAGPASGMNLANPKFVTTIWQINVVGQSPENAGGVWGERASTAKIEIRQSKTLSAGY